MKNSILRVLIILATAILLPTSALAAATACSTVKIEIAQELTLERL